MYTRLQAMPGEDSRRLRVGFTTPGLAMGGAEWWIVSLAENLATLEPAGVVVMEGHYTHPTLLARARRTMPVSLGGVDGSPAELVSDLAARSDVVISWGWGAIRELFAGTGIPRVEVSHCTSALHGQRELLAQSSAGAHYLAAVSGAAVECFPENLRAGVRVLPNGCDPNRVLPRLGRQRSRAQWLIPDEAKVIVYIGRLNESKRPDLIVSALSHLPPEYRAIFAGPDQGMRATIEREARKYASGRVAFAPVREHLGDLLALADVFCSPTRVEGHSLAANEAALAGVPLVTCDIPAVRELQTRHGAMCWTVPVECRVAELATAIEQAAEAGRQAPRVLHARNVALEHYTISAMAARWEEYLTDVVADWRRHTLYPSLNVVA